MELVYNLVEDNSIIKVCKIVNDYNNVHLAMHLVPSEITELNSITAQSRKNEFFTSRALLHSVFPERTAAIEYSETGKPLFVNTNISFSHSHNYASIIVNNNTAVGIDVEEFRPQILKIVHKFMSDSEQTQFLELTDITLVWSAKEALYKMYGSSPDFKNHYTIHKITKNQIFASIHTNCFVKECKLQYLRTQEFVLVWGANNV